MQHHPNDFKVFYDVQLRVGDRVRRPGFGIGRVESIETAPDGQTTVVVRHPRTVWRCHPGELGLVRRG